MTGKFYGHCIYGLGGSMLDPIGGMATINHKMGALGIIIQPQPWDQNNVQAVANAIIKQPPGSKTILIGDSCGANKAPWVAAAIKSHEVRITYMACIQASIWCNTGCPPIGDNVDQAFIIFSDWIHTGGLGVYIPPLADGNKTTKYRQSYVAGFHPGDNDVTRVQDPIFADIHKIMAA